MISSTKLSWISLACSRGLPGDGDGGVVLVAAVQYAGEGGRNARLQLGHLVRVQRLLPLAQHGQQLPAHGAPLPILQPPMCIRPLRSSPPRIRCHPPARYGKQTLAVQLTDHPILISPQPGLICKPCCGGSQQPAQACPAGIQRLLDPPPAYPPWHLCTHGTAFQRLHVCSPPKPARQQRVHSPQP